jgi:predicted DNA-binding ribbon-helix-helix protein
VLVKRSFSLSGHRTSVALEPEFWTTLDLMAAERGLTIACLVAALDADRPPGHPLASLLRVTALQHAHQNQRPSAISDVSLT